MRTEYILYVRKKNEPAYLESIFSTSFDSKRIKELQKQAIKNGFITRIATFDGETPDFKDFNLVN